MTMIHNTPTKVNLPAVTYDRSERAYRVIDAESGEIVETFPAGHKAEAERYAIAFFSPRLARIVQDELLAKRPYLEARAWRAAELVLSHAVAAADGLYVAYVAGSGDTYAIGHDGHGVTCTCPDYTGFGAPVVDGSGQRMCKHILAWRLWQRLQKRRCYHCEKLVDGAAEMCPRCGEQVTPY